MKITDALARDLGALAEPSITALTQFADSNPQLKRKIYIPVTARKLARNAAIQRLSGPAPHSRATVSAVASQVHCSERTVWRVLRAP